MRDHLGYYILGNLASNNVTAEAQAHDQAEEDFVENNYVPLAYQTVVDAQFKNFPDFASLYGPIELHGGNFSAFFQNNYTDPNSSDFEGQGIIITGTNNRTGFRQPFAPQDIVVLYDGYCASTCTVFSEYLKSYGNVQFVSVGGRPQTGPMQAVGGVKGVQIFEFASNMAIWVDLFQSPQNTYNYSDTIWENFTYDPILRSAATSAAGGGVNGRNHLRYGDDSNTPLQFVYEAADCRIWWTREMLYDPTFLWSRVANMAFQERRGTQFNSNYCVQGSTGHPTSIGGGWRTGTLGPQNPPQNSSATTQGWNLEGQPLGPNSTGSKKLGSTMSDVKVENDGVAHTATDDVTDSAAADSPELKSMKQACANYSGDSWLDKLICGALGT
jgi:hypothetical protein